MLPDSRAANRPSLSSNDVMVAPVDVLVGVGLSGCAGLHADGLAGQVVDAPAMLLVVGLHEQRLLGVEVRLA